MSNSWLRLWHDMPNDPKFSTVARKSSEPISLVLAMYVHLLVDASQHVTRGHVTVTVEDLASALEVEETRVQSILDAMQGRLMDGDYLTGWDRRQPKQEDAGNPETGAKSAAERQRDKRARDKAAKAAKDSESRQVTDGHAESREVTTDKDKEEEKEKNTPHTPQGGAGGAGPAKPTQAGVICRAIRLKGIADAHPGQADFVALVAKGVPVEAFEAAADTCLKSAPPKGFTYLLAIVKRQLAEANAIGAAAGMPDKPWDHSRSSILAKGAEFGLTWDDEHSLAPDRELLPAFTERVRRAIHALQPA